ncbi:hypothetical protein K443DRAFT_125165 [Laccaria amethystina LaAM-08-1]|uniref:gamma-glutamylcyclotransferase n=1 Tax=Laccaria amethystina LaAM-08-1 TaxID=1095629 RepID=A0A0C9XA73_9AGAR|nr:hypothetical protein K443DRAFT_125165 [Laccaria amethystina LaAM-08-1]
MSTQYNFAYGSNIWHEQMKHRCPGSKFYKIGTLSGRLEIYPPDVMLKFSDRDCTLSLALRRHRKWIINSRGVANIKPSPGDVVHGMLYSVTGRDLELLDKFEGQRYQRRQLDVTVTGSATNTVEGTPRHEYISRLHRGFADGVEKNIPASYFDKIFHPYVVGNPGTALTQSLTGEVEEEEDGRWN